MIRNLVSRRKKYVYFAAHVVLLALFPNARGWDARVRSFQMLVHMAMHRSTGQVAYYDGPRYHDIYRTDWTSNFIWYTNLAGCDVIQTLNVGVSRQYLCS